MKIKLIQPRMSLRPMDSEFKRLMSPSMSLLALAALTPLEHDLSIEDENVQELNLIDNPDLVGITVNVDTSQRAYEIAKVYRSRDIPVVFGGIHVSANPKEALKYADVVCIGEAEKVWAQILADTREGRLQGVYQSTEAVDPTIIPVPRWEAIDSNPYLYTNIIVASRGCPFQCEFCYNSSDYVFHEYRFRPVDKVVEEIKRFDTRHVMFIDDNLIGNIVWAKELVHALKPLKLKWNAAVTANLYNHLDLLDEMAESGCQSLFIGLESINLESIRSVHKYQNNREQYEHLIQEIHQRGIMISASLVFGLDHDYPEVFQETLDWLVKNKIETMTAHILTPYPGTALYKRYMEEERIKDLDLSHYNTAHVVFEPRNMSAEELYQGYLWIYKEFYSFRNILRRIPDHPRQRIPYLLFGLVYRKFGKFLSRRVSQMGLMHSLGRWVRKLSYNLE